MNEITLTGRVNQLTVRHTGSGDPVAKFSLAVDDGFYDRSKGQWVKRPTVWWDVVVFKPRLAGNVADTLQAAPNSGKGIAVTVTGTFSDNSYTREARREDEEDLVIRRTQIVASQVSLTLDTVTAVLTPDRLAQERARERAEENTTTPAAEEVPSRRPAGRKAAAVKAVAA